MLDKFLENSKYVSLVSSYVKDTISLLLEQNMQFSILANTSRVDFSPSLPENIISEFRPIITFALAGYTLDSTSIKGNNLEFEAGFGSDNVGSLVTIPLDGILQVVIEDTPILINLSLPKDEENESFGGVDKSMEALLSNPKNKGLIK